MTEQSFDSHAHRPVPTALAALFALAALILLVLHWWLAWPTLYVSLVFLTFSVFVLIAISRLYIVTLQDRIIMLEMKVRCAEVLPAGHDARLADLSPKQIVALRFASDAELGELLDRAIREKMPPAAIKQAVKHWRADHLRT